MDGTVLTSSAGLSDCSGGAVEKKFTGPKPSSMGSERASRCPKMSGARKMSLGGPKKMSP